MGRQETTMFKAGTLPLNMYRASDYPKDKVSFSLNTIEEETYFCYNRYDCYAFCIARGH